MLSCEVCETFKNTYFEEHLRTTASGWGSLKKLFLKLCNIHRTKVASDKCSVKKVFLKIARAVKVTFFVLINISCKKSVAG